MSNQPISIHYQQMEEWLNDRRSVFGRKNKQQFEKLMNLAPRLVQIVQYDIPALQKQVKRSANLLEECYRVCEDADRGQESLVNKRQSFLETYDLRSVPPLGGDQSLQAPIDERIERACTTLTDNLQSYSRTHLHAFSDAYEKTLSEISSGMYGEGSFALHFPWLARLRDEDALPLCAHLGGQCHDDTLSAQPATEEGPQIDWGDMDLGGQASGAVEEPVVEIQWDAVDEVVVVQDPEDDRLPDSDGKVFSMSVSRARDRANLIAELRAALCFAVERARATNDAGDSTFVTASRDMLENITNSSDALFVRMKTNFRAREMFEDDALRFHRMWTGLLSRKASHQSKAEELEKEVQQLTPQQEALLNTTREIRDDCLAQLQQIFPDRKVIIVGDINKYI